MKELPWAYTKISVALELGIEIVLLKRAKDNAGLIMNSCKEDEAHVKPLKERSFRRDGE